MLRKMSVFFLVLAILAATGLVVLTRGSGPSHPGLRAADLPPLIPTRAFFADPRAAYGYVASADGKYVALDKGSLTGLKVVVRDVASGDEIAEFPHGLRGVRWHPTRPLLRFIHQGDDWEVDPWNADPENWRRISPQRLSGGWIKNRFATRADGRELTWGKVSNRELAGLWLVSQDGLEAERIARGTSETQYWVMEAQGDAPRVRVDSLDPATQRMFVRDGEDWHELLDIALEDSFWPLSDMRADGTFLARSARGRDRAALVNFDVATGEEVVVVENPVGDIGRVSSLGFDGQPDFVRLGTNGFDRVALSERGRISLDVIAEFGQPSIIGALSPTPSGRYVTVALSPGYRSYIYLLVDLEKGSYEKLGEYHFRRFADHLVGEETVRFLARDGLEIPAIMMKPKGISGPIPYVVEIHGGPASHVSMGYDHFKQFLVNRGYGVLSVNFRGSTGFGKTFQAKGYREFGRAMQDDIADAARWLIKEGHADADAIAVMGASYGGYASALAMTRDRGLFKAAIVEFPMLDIAFQSRYHPGFWEQGINGWWRYFGKPDVPEDLALMEEFSPSARIGDLHGPLMIIAGNRDQITAVQQVRDFEQAAAANGKNVTAHYFPQAGHGIVRWQDRLRRARLIEDFLSETIGGRTGGFELVEWAVDMVQ